MNVVQGSVDKPLASLERILDRVTSNGGFNTLQDAAVAFAELKNREKEFSELKAANQALVKSIQEDNKIDPEVEK